MIVALFLACSSSEPPHTQTELPHAPNPNLEAGEIDPDLHIPSSFVQLEDHTVDSMKARIQSSIDEQRPLYTNFGRRSRSRVVADGLNLQADDILADIGAGTGAFETLLLEGGYDFQKVYAIDTDKDPLDFLDWMMEAAKLDSSRVDTVHSNFSSITLPSNSVTKALLLNTPFYLDSKGQPSNNTSARACMKSIVDAIQPNGLLHIVERHVGKEEEDLHIDDPPEQHCSHLAEAFTSLGLELQKMEMVQLAKLGEPAHCRVILQKK